MVIAALGAGIHPRYFLFALPVGYLAGTQGISLAVRWALQLKPGLSVPKAEKIQLAVYVLIVAVACVPLARYYEIPKQDYEGAIELIRTEGEPGDRIVAADMAGFAIGTYYDPRVCSVATIQELRALEARGGRVWVIATLERGMANRAPAMLESLRNDYELVKWLPGSIGDGGMRVYSREAVSPASDANCTIGLLNADEGS